jgi:hypothetical protein
LALDKDKEFKEWSEALENFYTNMGFDQWLFWKKYMNKDVNYIKNITKKLRHENKKIFQKKENKEMGK